MSQPTSPTDPLAELRAQLDATTRAAERLAAETAFLRAEEQPRVPPAGWATPDERAGRQQELEALMALVEALRDLVPPELKQQVQDVLRQVLLLLRALIDWWVQRIDGPEPVRPGPGPQVEEIPID